MTKSNLAPKRHRFVEEYLVDHNATQAAIRAGYSPKTADRQGHRLLKNAEIAAAVEVGRERLSEATDITAKRVLAELARIAFLDPRAVFDESGSLKPITEWDEDAARALSGCDVTEEFEGRGAARDTVGYLKKVRFWDKRGALEMLGKHLSLFADKVEHSGPGGGPIETRDATVDLTKLSTETLRKVHRELAAQADAKP